MGEGSIEAPIRHAISWQHPDFTDHKKLDVEMRRQFDVCHGCRRCFNLCDSFPRLFDLIDGSESGELDTVDSKEFKPVVDACTLCDMCFLTKCPYVPPHEFNIDFPHLMLRARAADFQKVGAPFGVKQLIQTDRNGKLAGIWPGFVNWVTGCDNRLTRPILERVLGVHRDAVLPKFHKYKLTRNSGTEKGNSPGTFANGRKAVLYATCFTNYNNPDIGVSAQAVLAKNQVETEVVYNRCCGMPQLEQGDIAAVAKAAKATALEFSSWIDGGYDVIALTPSCALMLKYEWPLIVENDANVKKLSAATFDISEYIVGIAKTEGLANGLSALDGGITMHIACHARAQNIGRKGAEMLQLIPDTEITVIERCSGHGGSWGIMKNTFEVGIKVGKPVARKAAKANSTYIVSECPLARDHILQGIERLGETNTQVSSAQHPVQLLAKAYGI